MTTTPGSGERRRHVVRCRKIPHENRTTAAPVLARPDSGYENVWNADDDPTVPYGVEAAYVALLTDDEAAAFREAENCDTVEPDLIDTHDPVEVIPSDHTAADGIPDRATMAYMGADTIPWDGAGTVCAVLDGGASPAVMTRIENRVIAKRNFTSTPEGPDGYTSDHGCLVIPDCLPPGTGLLDYIICDDAGASYQSTFAAALRTAVDAGAHVVNYSSSGPGSSSIQRDALTYARDRNVLVFCSAGNDGRPDLDYPARLSGEYTYWNVISSIAFDQRTDRRASFSNYGTTVPATGCGPGVRVVSLRPDGTVVLWSGTSASAPLMARLALMAIGAGYSPVRVAEAFKATARDTGAPAAEQGRGAWHLGLAHAHLTAPAASDPVAPTPTVPPIADPEPEPEPEPEPPPLRAEKPAGCLAALFGHRRWPS